MWMSRKTNEKQWLASTHPTWMLEIVRTKMSQRKLRLFAVACCRRTEHLFVDARCHEALEVAERFADALATSNERLSTAVRVRECRRGSVGRQSKNGVVDNAVGHAQLAASFLCGSFPFEAAQAALTFCPRALAFMADDFLATQRQEELHHCDLLRDIVGMPFQKRRADPSWFTSNTVSLARAIYDNRRFDDLPILADALEEAGCVDEIILAHCRETPTHARGCWVLDLLLGTE